MFLNWCYIVRCEVEKNISVEICLNFLEKIVKMFKIEYGREDFKRVFESLKWEFWSNWFLKSIIGESIINMIYFYFFLNRG